MSDLHTIDEPLVLQFTSGALYRVNKPYQEDQELVSKEIAEELYETLEYCIDIVRYVKDWKTRNKSNIMLGNISLDDAIIQARLALEKAKPNNKIK